MIWLVIQGTLILQLYLMITDTDYPRMFSGLFQAAQMTFYYLIRILKLPKVEVILGLAALQELALIQYLLASK